MFSKKRWIGSIAWGFTPHAQNQIKKQYILLKIIAVYCRVGYKSVEPRSETPRY